MTDSDGKGIRRLVLDVLKPHQPSLPELALEITKIPGIVGVNISLIEIDRDTESIKITIEGIDLMFEKIRTQLNEWNCSIHSIDQVVAGRKVIEEAHTHTD
ncbi:MAG: DUF211 domain-containing protein [Candidatus Helarchaeota archaeon]